MLNIFFLSSALYGTGLVVDNEVDRLYLDGYMRTWQPGGHLPDLEEALKWPEADMEPLNGMSLYTSYFGASVWGKCGFSTSSDLNRDLYLLVQRTFHIELDVYLQKGESSPKRLDKEPLRAGNSIPHFRLDLQPGQSYTIFIHLDNYGSVGAHPVLLLNHQELLYSFQIRQFFNGSFYGIVFLILLFTTYYHLRFRWRPLLFYNLYLATTTAMIFCWEGYAYAFTFPENPELNPLLLSLSVNLGMFFGVRFFIEFLQPHSHSRWLGLASNLVSYAFLAALPFALFSTTNHYLIFFNNFLALFGIVFLIFGGILLIPQRKRLAWSYLLAVVLLGVGVLLQVVENTGVPSHTFDRLSYLEMGFVLEFIVLAGTLLHEWRKRWENEQAKAMHTLEKLHESKGLLLSSRMKPHFLFNSLASIQNFILINQKEDAVGYISQFSRLVRRTLDLSNKPVISLEEELEMLKLYVSLEKARTQSEFELVVNQKTNLKFKRVMVPNMLLQPFVENAIWHGLRGVERKCEIVIGLEEVGEWLHFSIQDNGRGREAARSSRPPQPGHKSSGLEITRQRICIHNGWDTGCEAVKITDLWEGEHAAGTRVEFRLRIHR